MAEPANHRTRVLYVTLGLGTGGAERSMVDMLPRLESNGIDMHVFCRQSRTGAQADVDLSKVRFSAARSLAGWVHETRALIRELEPDVVHTALFEADITGRLAAIGTRTPVLTSLVNMSYENSRRGDPNVSRWKLVLVRQIEGLTARRLTTHFHAITEAVARSAVRYLRIDPTRITVIYRGRDQERLGTPSRERRTAWRRAHSIGDEPVLLVIGRQEYQKGQEIAIRAMPSVLDRYPTAKLVLVGRPGRATPSIDDAITELGIANAVIRTGHVSDVGAALCGADVLVFPSRFEGLGGVLLEALAMQIPIVAFDIPPVREVLEGTALLAQAGDVAAFAQAIVATLDDRSATARRVEVGARLFDEKFRIEHVAIQMTQLYRRVAGISP